MAGGSPIPASCGLRFRGRCATPSRIDRDLEELPILAAAPDFQSEKLLAYEIGYRGQPTPQTSVSVSLYWDQYSDLRTLDYTPNGTALYQLGNDEAGHTYGIEAWGDWRVLSWWKLSAGVNLMHKDLHVLPGVQATDEAGGDDPGYQFFLHSFMDLPHDVRIRFRIPGGGPAARPDCGRLCASRGADRLASDAGNRAIPRRQQSARRVPCRGREAGTAPLEVQRSIYLGLRWKY